MRVDKENLKIGMKVKVQGKYDRYHYVVEILDLGENMFVHKARFIISCSNYKDIIEIVTE